MSEEKILAEGTVNFDKPAVAYDYANFKDFENIAELNKFIKMLGNKRVISVESLTFKYRLWFWE